MIYLYNRFQDKENQIVAGCRHHQAFSKQEAKNVTLPCALHGEITV